MRQLLIFSALIWTLSLSARSHVPHSRQTPTGQKGGDSVSKLFILGGELSNSAATSIEDIDEVMPRMAALGLNTVLVPACWDLMEPTEGKYDFTLIDRVIDRARENKLHVVFLWFGAWKNSMSCYAPLWFKQDTRKYPRAMTASGKPLEIASCFSENVYDADCRAFTRLMEHIAQKDKGTGTVIMIQIENEIGMLEDARDHSPLAEKAYNEPIPTKLMDALERDGHKGFSGISGLTDITKQSFKAGKTTWREAFGSNPYGEECFMAWHYACYVERLAQVARRIYDVPLYVNAAMNSRGRKPGEYPSAGPLAHLATIWKCGAPSIDMLSPDIYDTGFRSWASQYAIEGNPLFIPETRCCENSGARALYTFGEYDAVGFSPFAIDQYDDPSNVTNAYSLLRQMHYYITNNAQSTKTKVQSSKTNVQYPRTTWGLLFDQEDKERIIEDGDVVLTCRHNFTLPWDSRATDGSAWPEGGAYILKLSATEYLIAGQGIVVEFKTKSEKEQEVMLQLGEDGFVEGQATGGDGTSSKETPRFKGKRLGIGHVDQVSISDDGTMKFLRRDNGDQDHQGRHARIGVGEWKILHVKLYEYSN